MTGGGNTAFGRGSAVAFGRPTKYLAGPPRPDGFRIVQQVQPCQTRFDLDLEIEKAFAVDLLAQ